MLAGTMCSLNLTRSLTPYFSRSTYLCFCSYTYLCDLVSTECKSENGDFCHDARRQSPLKLVIINPNTIFVCFSLYFCYYELLSFYEHLYRLSSQIRVTRYKRVSPFKTLQKLIRIPSCLLRNDSIAIIFYALAPAI